MYVAHEGAVGVLVRRFSERLKADVLAVAVEEAYREPRQPLRLGVEVEVAAQHDEHVYVALECRVTTRLRAVEDDAREAVAVQFTEGFAGIL